MHKNKKTVGIGSTRRQQQSKFNEHIRKPLKVQQSTRLSRYRIKNDDVDREKVKPEVRHPTNLNKAIKMYTLHLYIQQTFKFKIRSVGKFRHFTKLCMKS